MPRPRSDEKRTAILEAATRVIVSQGLGAPTATMAREAGIATGSLFTYFETKSKLLNQLYVELKVEMASAALAGVSPETDLRERFSQIWTNWIWWAQRHPEKRRVLALLDVSEEITPASRAVARERMAEVAALMEQVRVTGPLRGTSFVFAATLMEALAEATMDFVVEQPVNPDEYVQAGFDALWRALT